MPPTFQRFQQGQLFRPNQQTVNGMMAAAEAHQFHARDPGDAGNEWFAPRYQFDGIYVQVRNDSGSAMPRFGIGGLNGPLISDAQNLAAFQQQPRFSLVTPTAAAHTGKFCVVLEPLAAGAISSGQGAILCGTCPVQIRLAAAPPAGVWTADVSDGYTTYLEPAAGGCVQVLWANTAGVTGYPATVWALVRLGNVPDGYRLCTLQVQLNAGGTATAQLVSNSAMTLMVTDEFLAEGQSLPSGARIGVMFDPTLQIWIVVNAQCPT
jgi:hypothetical protein